MKSDTKKQVIEFIKKNGSSRPWDLATTLKLSPQAIHKQLRRLVGEGLLEPEGSPPFTRYRLAGLPNFRRAVEWFQADRPPAVEELCETRDAFTGRLSRLVLLKNKGLSDNDLSELISAVGEIGNNSFDHSLGQWRDVAGCWFETDVTGNRIYVLIADRGQGVFRSISGVISARDDQDALEIAFLQKISGRTPERRGNGLKYVRNIVDNSTRGLACRSGAGQIEFGGLAEACSEVMKPIKTLNYGTITALVWGLL